MPDVILDPGLLPYLVGGVLLGIVVGADGELGKVLAGPVIEIGDRVHHGELVEQGHVGGDGAQWGVEDVAGRKGFTMSAKGFLGDVCVGQFPAHPLALLVHPGCLVLLVGSGGEDLVGLDVELVQETGIAGRPCSLANSSGIGVGEEVQHFQDLGGPNDVRHVLDSDREV